MSLYSHETRHNVILAYSFIITIGVLLLTLVFGDLSQPLPENEYQASKDWRK
jgi:hypothetical protein